MIKKIQGIFLVLALSLGLATPVLFSATANAAVGGQFCSGVNSAAQGDFDDNTCGDAKGGLEPKQKIKNIANTVVDIFSIVVGVVAIIMIIYAGFRYITSGGDTNRVTSAKHTLLYAIIGIVIVALAQFIVNWVFTVSTTSTG